VYTANCFFLVLARNRKHVEEKIDELKSMQMPFIIISGEQFNHPNVIYRKASGKWDAINFGAKFVPKEAQLVVLNDVDTSIHNFEYAFHCLSKNTDLVYCRVKVLEGPQTKFYKILDPIRKRFHIAASGELMLIKRNIFERITPIPPCIAEDTYILFKALELRCRAYFCTKTFVTTNRTTNATQEEAYKIRTTLGIYQSLKHSKPPLAIRIFYVLLPITAMFLVIWGKDGRAWMNGIQKAVKHRASTSQPTKF
jgi:hypothetical protein